MKIKQGDIIVFHKDVKGRVLREPTSYNDFYIITGKWRGSYWLNKHEIERLATDMERKLFLLEGIK